MTNNDRYFFDDIDHLIHYLTGKYGCLSPLKLQKGLYFLFSYYGALYGKNREMDKFSEVSYNFPPYLFNAKFEAWNYGPVIREVYFANKRGDYKRFEKEPIDEESVFKGEYEIKAFIDELFKQVNTTSDFSLVDRSHEDDVWKRAFAAGQAEMLKEDIVREYSTEFLA